MRAYGHLPYWLALVASLTVSSCSRQEGALHIVRELKLTSIGSNRDAAWSPDGNRIAFCSDRKGEYDIWIMDVPEGEVSEEWEKKAICLTGDDGADDLYPVWSPDGRWIAYISQGDIWSISPEGGKARRITEDGDVRAWPIAWSPDGTKIAFARARENIDLWTVDLKTGEEERLTSPIEHDISPSWSPGGDRIAFSSDRLGTYDIWVLDMATGDFSRITDWPSDEGAPCWSPDGRWLLFVAQREDNQDIWVMPSGGKAFQLTRTSEHEFLPRWSPDGSRISFHRTAGAEVLLAPISGGNPRTVSFPYTLRIQDLAWSPDGTHLVVAGSTVYGRPTIWLLDPAGGNVKALSEIQADRPSWSPDGKRIAFASLKGGNPDIWTLSVSGGRPKQVTIEPSRDGWPAWSPDGSEIAFASDRTGTYSIWVIPSTGGNPRNIAVGKENFFMPSWSPDGNWIAFLSSCNPEKPPCSPSLWKVGAKGGRPVRLASLNPGIPLALLWSGDGIYYMDATSDRRSVRVWKVPEGGGRPSIVRKVLPPRPLFKPFAGALSSDALAVGLPLRANIWIAKIAK